MTVRENDTMPVGPGVEAARAVYSSSGIGSRMGMGHRPSVLVVDLQYGFTDPSCRVGSNLDEVVDATARLLDAARSAALPIAFTVIGFHPSGRDGAVWIRKMPGLAELVEGTRWCEVDDRVRPADDEPVFTKRAASAFFGTPLLSYLVGAQADTVIVVGCVTSGCVRASVVDAVSYGLRPIVPFECVGDRATGTAPVEHLRHGLEVRRHRAAGRRPGRAHATWSRGRRRARRSGDRPGRRLSAGRMLPTQARGESGFVDSDGVRLHYLRYGEPQRRLVVVVPGITSPAITWEFAAEPLAADREVVVLDVRGRGLSDRPRGGYTLIDYARDVAALVAHLGQPRPPIVLGHSMGARIAAAFAVLFGDQAGPLLMVDPPLTGPGRDPYPTSLETFMEQLSKAKAGATAEDMRPFFPTWTEEQLRMRAEWLPTCDEIAVRETWLNFHREDLFAYLRELTPPALFMYGAQSPVVTEEALVEVRAVNPAIDLVAVADAGHMIPWDNLDAFLAETRSFIERTQ